MKDILWEFRNRLGFNVLARHGVKGQEWGVRSGPPYPPDKGEKSDTIADIEIGKSVGAKSKSYGVLDPESREYFRFSEGTHIRDAQVFVGEGVSKPLNAEVTEGLPGQVGGEPGEWQHYRGMGIINYHGEEIDAEVHWSQEPSIGKRKFKIKK